MIAFLKRVLKYIKTLINALVKLITKVVSKRGKMEVMMRQILQKEMKTTQIEVLQSNTEYMDIKTNINKILSKEEEDIDIVLAEMLMVVSRRTKIKDPEKVKGTLKYTLLQMMKDLERKNKKNKKNGNKQNNAINKDKDEDNNKNSDQGGKRQRAISRTIIGSSNGVMLNKLTEAKLTAVLKDKVVELTIDPDSFGDFATVIRASKQSKSTIVSDNQVKAMGLLSVISQERDRNICATVAHVADVAKLIDYTPLNEIVYTNTPSFFTSKKNKRNVTGLGHIKLFYVAQMREGKIHEVIIELRCVAIVLVWNKALYYLFGLNDDSNSLILSGGSTKESTPLLISSAVASKNSKRTVLVAAAATQHEYKLTIRVDG